MRIAEDIVNDIYRKKIRTAYDFRVESNKINISNKRNYRHNESQQNHETEYHPTDIHCHLNELTYLLDSLQHLFHIVHHRLSDFLKVIPNIFESNPLRIVS